MATSQQTQAPGANHAPIRSRRGRSILATATLTLAAVSCSSATEHAVTDPTPAPESRPTQAPQATESPATNETQPSTARTPTTESPTQSPTAAEPVLPQRPSWLGTRDLTQEDGSVATGLDTPPELTDRRFATIDRLPPPDPEAGFVSSVEPLSDDILEASTWSEGCPVPPEDLRYLTLTFWGFDDRAHTGDMIVHADVADDVTSVFAELFDSRYPIEEMRIITDADLIAPRSGDGNVTAAFVCRAARGSSRFSEHAYGLAIDINPFLNPYLRGEVLLPELSRHYLPRDLGAPGQVVEGDVVTTAFERIGWAWGGNWNSLIDYQHFSLNNR